MQKVIIAPPAVLEYDKVLSSYLRGYKAATSPESKEWWRNYSLQRTAQICANHKISREELEDAWFKWLDEVDASG